MPKAKVKELYRLHGVMGKYSHKIICKFVCVCVGGGGTLTILIQKAANKDLTRVSIPN